MRWLVPCLLLAVCAACRQETAVVVQTTAPAVAAGGRGVPSEAEIAAFVEKHYPDPSSRDQWIGFEVEFGVARLRPPIMGEFRERGKIPFVVSVNFYRQEQDRLNARFVNFFSLMDGQAEIAVLDAEGNLVDRTRQDLGLLCPS